LPHVTGRIVNGRAQANAEILTAMKRFDEQAHATERHTAIRILNHTFVVDRIFAATSES
jgi:hypothetical protein